MNGEYEGQICFENKERYGIDISNTKTKISENRKVNENTEHYKKIGVGDGKSILIINEHEIVFNLNYPIIVPPTWRFLELTEKSEGYLIYPINYKLVTIDQWEKYREMAKAILGIDFPEIILVDAKQSSEFALKGEIEK